MSARSFAAFCRGRWTQPYGALFVSGPVFSVIAERRQKERSLRAEINLTDASNLRPHHLATWLQDGDSAFHESSVNTVINPMVKKWPGRHFVNPDELVMGHIITNDSKQAARDSETANGCFRANATRHIYWDPKDVRAAIVTCGGLCPGLNSVVRELTDCLYNEYGVKDILGMRGGYHGLSNPEELTPMYLTPKIVNEIHMKGGSVLMAGRGGNDCIRIVDKLKERDINMLFVVGGDGTQSGAHALFLEARKRKMPISIVGVPKSIDNDVMYFDKTFGFESAVAEAVSVIRGSFVEATSANRAVSIVKLMGRDAGFVSMYAAVASNLVDLCLIPEVDVKLQDVLAYVDKVLAQKGYMVVAVAEGAGQNFVESEGVDPTGHTKYGDVGVFLRDAINEHLKRSDDGGRSFYFDPSYMIRAVPANPIDHIFCSRLSRDAVHTAMRGYTGVCVGPIHNIIIIMPMNNIASRQKTVNVHRNMWQVCVHQSGMPQQLAGF